MKISADIDKNHIGDLNISIDDNKTGELTEALVEALKKDKIVSGDHVTIQIKDGSLFINGEKQSEELTKKYKQYIDSKKNVNISIDVSK
jgi:DNA helicase TIP49 (TBP-interacting protein)